MFVRLQIVEEYLGGRYFLDTQPLPQKYFAAMKVYAMPNSWLLASNRQNHRGQYTITTSLYFNPTLPGVSGDLFSLGKDISCLVPPHSVWRGTGN
jgi:hypothetical protein